MSAEEFAARIAELEAFVLRLAERIYAAHEVLANLAEKKVKGKKADNDNRIKTR